MSPNHLFQVMYYQRLQQNSSIREKIILCCLFRLDYENRALVNQFELSGPGIHATIFFGFDWCWRGAVRVLGDFAVLVRYSFSENCVALVRCGPLFYNFWVSGAVRSEFLGHDRSHKEYRGGVAHQSITFGFGFAHNRVSHLVSVRTH